MAFLVRLIAPAALAAALGVGGLFPAPARAGDDLVRVIVDIADVVIRSGHPYYRHGGHGYDNRLIVERDRYGRPIYYRYVPREVYRQGPPYGNAWGHHRNRGNDRLHSRTRCDSRGRCRVEYYDPRYDNRYRYSGYDDHRYDGRRYDDRRYDRRYDDRHYDHRYDSRYYSRQDRDRDDDD